MNLTSCLLAFGAAAGLLCSPASAVERYALLVAIDDYSNVSGASNLPGCTADLEGVNTLLTGKLGFPSGNVGALTNGAATKANVLRELDALIAKAKPGDAVVFYFSGHGTQVPDLNDDDEVSDGLDEALVTSDFNGRNPGSWLLDDHLRASLSRLKTSRALVLIDACHSGTGTRGDIINKRAEFGFRSMLGRGRVDKDQLEAAKDAPQTHVLISGCAANELSGMGNYDGVVRSLFTTAFLNVAPQVLSAPLPELDKALHAEMRQLHPEAADEQHPQLETGLKVSLGTLMGVDGEATDEDVAVLDQPNEQTPVEQPSDGLPSAFPVTVMTDKSRYVPGDTMVAGVVSEKPGYLRLYYVDKTGAAALIFPNHYQRDNRIEGKQRIEIGGESFPFKFRMKAPGGTELLLAAVSETQFTDHDALDFSLEKPLKDMGEVTSLRKLSDTGTRAISVEARENPASIGRAAWIYEIREAAKSAREIVRQIEVEGRAEFDEQALPFKFDSTELATDAAMSQLGEIARALQSPRLKEARFVVEGHTCDLGKEDYNLDLSKRRASAIKKLLGLAGIGDERLSIEGLGEARPVAPNSSDLNRARNRRVEIKLVK